MYRSYNDCNQRERGGENMHLQNEFTQHQSNHSGSMFATSSLSKHVIIIIV